MSNLFPSLLKASANDNAFDLDALIASKFDVWFAPDGPLGRWACEPASTGQATGEADPPPALLSAPALVAPILEQASQPQAAALPLIETALETPFNWSDFQSGMTDLLGHVDQLTHALQDAVQNSHSGEEFVSSICTFVRDWLSGQTSAGATFTPDEPITQSPDPLGWLGGYDPYG